MSGEKLFEIRVEVFPKPALRDPSAEEILRAIREFGEFPLEELKMGKTFVLRVRAENSERALLTARQIADQFLANPQLENFKVYLEN